MAEAGLRSHKCGLRMKSVHLGASQIGGLGVGRDRATEPGLQVSDSSTVCALPWPEETAILEYKFACRQHTHSRTHSNFMPPCLFSCFLGSGRPSPFPPTPPPQPQSLLLLNSQTTRPLLREAFPDVPTMLSAALCAWRCV